MIVLLFAVVGVTIRVVPPAVKDRRLRHRGAALLLSAIAVGQTKKIGMSWAHDLTKSQRRELRRLIGVAHDRELSTALNGLEEQFRRWRSGEIGPHELNDAIHAFHQGPSRQLWVRYNDGLDDLALTFALRHGIVAEHEVAPDLLEVVKRTRLVDG